MSAARRILFSLVTASVLFLSIVFGADDLCLNPGRQPDRDAIPCVNRTTGRPTGLCCHPGDICYDIGVCGFPRKDPTQPLSLYRGTCVNGWFEQLPGCSEWCLEHNSSSLDDVVFHSCWYKEPTDLQWYCDTKPPRKTVERCDKRKAIFEFPESPSAYDIAGLPPTSSTPSSSMAMTTDESTTEIKPTATLTTTDPSAPSNGDDDNPNPNPFVPITIGVAVGISILLAIIALLFCYIRKKKRRQAPPRAATPPPLDGFRFVQSQAPEWIGPVYEQQQQPQARQARQEQEQEQETDKVPDVAELSGVCYGHGRPAVDGGAELDGSPVVGASSGGSADGGNGSGGTQRGRVLGGPLGSSPVTLQSGSMSILGARPSIRSVSSHNDSDGSSGIGCVGGEMPASPPSSDAGSSAQTGGMSPAGVPACLVPGGGRHVSGHVPMPPLPELP
ncbi:hypothetical protein VTJ04DRAFT_9620 [Mycothermus thermophilus]|uniref:uncharacterized protein n=1 Tax=Humicola insolens TaxID=85995 RepID=UPI003742D373